MSRPRTRVGAVAGGLLALLLVNAAWGVDSSWNFEEGTGTIAYDAGGVANLTLSGATWTTGRSGGWATSYNGTSSYASTTVDLSGTNAITVAFWLKWTTFANDDKLAVEYTVNYFSGGTAFMIDPNGSSGNFDVEVKGNVGVNGVLFTRPSAGVWHHYAFVMDLSQASNEVVPYVDGVAVSYTHQWTANNTNGWIAQADEGLYIMSRAGTSCFGAGAIDDLHLYKSALSASEITALAAGSDSFAGRFTLAGAVGTCLVTNASATLEAGEPVHPDSAGGHSVWMTWTAPSDGMLMLTTENSSFDTLLSVYTGAVISSLTLCASNDDEVAGNTTTSRIEMPVAGGTTYQIRADGKFGATGTMQLRWAFGPGVGIFREVWMGIAGVAVSDLTSDGAYPNSPTSSAVLAHFGDHVELPGSSGSVFGDRMRGWFYAPQTGNYVFQIASDDAGQLFLSTDSNSANKANICSVAGWTSWRNWGTGADAQTSSSQALTAGSWNYIEVLHKEGGGGDHWSIAVTYPDGTAEKPMERVHICPYATQTIAVDATAVSVPENGTATFRVRLGRVPEASTTVAVARASGDSDVSVSGGSSLVFTSANWNTWQTVTLAAATDGDATNGSATIRCSSSGLTNVDVTATEIDRDVDAVTITSPTVAHVYLPDGTEQLILQATVTTASHATPTLAWTKQSGPGTVTFSASTAATTNASFSASGTYVLRLTANGSFYAQETVDVVPGGDVSSWTSADIGSPSPAGSTSISNGTITISGGGGDISGTSDQFRFAYTTVTGDATVICQVTHEQYINDWSKVGIMFRDGTAAGAVNFCACISPDDYVSTQSRTSTGGATSNGLLLSGIPVWLKVVRSGNDFLTSTSTDGVTWVYFNTTTVSAMPSTANVGLALTSHNNGVACTATVTNVSVRPTSGATNYAPLVLAGPDASADLSDEIIPIAAAASDDGLPLTPGTLTTTWSTVSGPGTVTFANASSPATTVTFSTAGTYVLRLTGDDGSVKVCDDVTYTYTTTSPQRYWVGTSSGTWRNTANWATGSNGTPGASLPGAGTAVFFDGAGSCTGACALTQSATIASITCSSAYTGTIAFGASALTVTGNVDLRSGAGTPFCSTTSGILLTGSSGQTFIPPPGGKTVPAITQNGAGGTTLSTNDLSTTDLTVLAGTFAANGRAITLSGSYAQSGGGFTGGTAAMTIATGWSLSGGTFTATSGTLQAPTLTQSGGTFTAGSGTVSLVSSSRRALTVSDPLNNLTLTGSEAVETGLIRRLKLDENSGTSTADAVGSNTGTLANGTAWSTSTPSGLAFTDAASLSFDGVDDAVTAGSNPTTPTGTFTMALWAYPTATINLYSESAAGLPCVSSERFAIMPTFGNGGQAGAGISIGTNGIIVSELASSHLPPLATWATTITGWTHIVVVFVANRPTIYINGVAVHTGAQSSYTTFPSMKLGGNDFGAAYAGNLDDVRWYNYALSAAEINELAGGCGSGRWALANALSLNGNLQIVSGALSANACDMTIAGSWTNSGGVFVPGVRTVTFNGTAGSKTITSRAMPFYNLTIAGSGGGWSLGDALTVTNALAISAGQLSVSGSNFAVKAGTISQSGGVFVPGTGTVTLSSTVNQSVSTISSLYNLNVGVGSATDSAASGLVLHYPLDEGSGATSAEAFTGNGQYALALTGTTWSTDVPIPYPGARSLSFTADGQYAKLVAAGSNRLDPYAYAVDDNFTLALWVKPTATRNSTTQANSGVTGTGGQRYVLFPAQGHADNIDGTNQTTGTGISAGTNGISVFEHSDGFLPSVLVYDATISGWTHLAVVYTARVPTLYVNGTLVATGVAASGFSHVRAEPILGDVASGYGPYRGYVDDVRFYGRSLTGTEVAQLAAGANVDGHLAATRYTLTTDLDCDGSLTVTNGELAASTRTVHVGGAWTNIAGFVCGTSTVILDGGNQTIDGSTTFYNLTKSVTSAATLTFPVGGETQTVTGTLTLAGVTGNRLTLASQSPSTQWRLDPQGTRACNFLVVSDGFNVSSAIINPRNSVNGGNNTRWFTGRGVGVAIGYPLIF